MNDASGAMERPVTYVELPVHPLTAAGFAPFGQVIASTPDGKLFGPDDPQLDIGRGIPRFYIMELLGRPSGFNSITRHRSVTQCLASVGAKPWIIAVAPPNDPDNAFAQPDPDKIMAFRVPGHQGIMLYRSTWHAGPYFEGDRLDFFNLELSDTNQVDHTPCRLDLTFGLRFGFAPE